MTKAKKIIFITTLLAVVGLALAGYFFYQLYTIKKNPQAIADQEVASLVSKISKLILLPEGETPTVATVSDTEALKDQVFFARAQQGDKVLIYAEAKKAFLYSITLNKILEVAPLNIGDKDTKTIPTTPTPTPADTKE